MKRKFRELELNNKLDEIAEIIEASIRTNFEVGGRFGNGRFGSGSQKWYRSKRAEICGGKTLIKTGNLMNSIKVIVSNTMDGISIDIKVGASYGKYHQDGTKKLPPRPFLTLQLEDLRRIGEVMGREDRIAEVVVGGG